MPKYRVLEKSLIGATIVEAGDEVEYDGLPSGNLEPLCDEGRARAEEAKAVSRASLDQLIRDYQPPTGSDPAAFAASVGKAIADALATVGVKPKAKPKAEDPASPPEDPVGLV